MKSRMTKRTFVNNHFAFYKTRQRSCDTMWRLNLNSRTIVVRHGLPFDAVGIRWYSQTSVRYNLNNNEKGLFAYAQVPNKSYIRIVGPDAPRFLNGLVSSKLLPSFEKKNLTTIVPDSLSASQQVSRNVEFEEKTSNWGIYNESGNNGPFLSRFGLYTGFLNSKGKLITDSIIYPTPLVPTTIEGKPQYPSYLLEFDDSIVERIAKVFDTHQLSSKIKYKIIPKGNLKTWDIQLKLPNVPTSFQNPWIDNIHMPMQTSKITEEATDFAENILTTLFDTSCHESIISCFIDNRMNAQMEADNQFPQLLRVITTANVANLDNFQSKDVFPFDLNVVKRDASYFRELRLNNGVVDGLSDYKSETIWPLELNFDHIPNAINANKGCYCGQEATHRMISSGLVRKRVVPVKFSSDGMQTSEKKHFETVSQTIINEAGTGDVNNAAVPKMRRERPFGTVIVTNGKIGLALVRIEHFSKIFGNESGSNSVNLVVESEGGKLKVVPHKPLCLKR